MLSLAKFLFYSSLLFVGFIFWRSFDDSAFLNTETTHNLAPLYNKRTELSGFVCEEADVDYKSCRLTLCASEKILITASLYPEYDYGDFVRVSGYLIKPEKFEGFDYPHYLARYGIYALMYYPKITLESADLSLSQSVFRFLLDLKQGIKKILELSLPEPEAGLAAALLLGYRRTIYEDEALAFSRTGLSHLIAISGSHITIINAMLLNFMFFIGASRRLALRFVFVFLIVYPFVTGLSASAVRSAIMGTLIFLALYYGRLSVMIRAITLAAALMLSFNPLLLRDDIGFQLSFAAVLGIIYVYPIFQPFIAGVKNKFKIGTRKVLVLLAEIFSLTIACQLVVTPIMLINFKQFSLMSFIANPAVAWIFPVLLAALIIPIIPAAIFPGLGPWLFLPAYLLLKFLLGAARFLSQPSWAVFSVQGFGYFEAAIYYFILFCLVFLFRFKGKRVKQKSR